MKRPTSFLVVLLLATTALWAYDFKVGDLYYNILDDGQSVEVTRGEDRCYQNLEHISIPASVMHDGTTYAVTSIDDYTFSGNDALKIVDLPSTLQSIKYRAFYYTKLSSIRIPENIKNIERSAFGGDDLYEGYFQLAILMPHTPPTISNQDYYDGRSFPKGTTFIVHKEDTAAYRAAGYDNVTLYGLVLSNPLSTQATFSGDLEFVTLEDMVPQKVTCLLNGEQIAESTSSTLHIACTGLTPNKNYTITMRAELKGSDGSTPEVITKDYNFTTRSISISLSSPKQTQKTIGLRMECDLGDVSNKGINGIQYCLGTSLDKNYTTIALNKKDVSTPVDTTLTGLQLGTTYCARAYMVFNEKDTVYSRTITASTKAIATTASITRLTQTKVGVSMQYDWGEIDNIEQYGYEIAGTIIADTAKVAGTQSEVLTIDTTFAGFTPDTEYTLRTFIETRDSTNAIFADDFSKGISDWRDGSSYYSWFKSVDGACAYSGYPWSPVDGTLSYNVSLTAGIEYTLRVLVKKAMASGANIPNVAITVGDSTIVARETLSTEYEELSGVFTPITDGDYRIGLYVYMNDDANVADTVYFDDFAVLLPASIGKMPITISNEHTFKTLAVTTTITSTKRTQTKLGVRFTYDWGEVDNIEQYGYKILNGDADAIQAMGTIDAPIKIDTFITGLTPNTEYTFRSFMKTRDSTNIILSDDFSNGIDEWEQQIGAFRGWTTYDSYCKFGGYGSRSGWLFHSVNLIGGTEYTFRVRVKKQYTGDWYVVPDMAIGIGSSANSSSMTTVVSKENLSTEYGDVVGTYTPIESGLYYVGLYAHTQGPSYYYANSIYFADFSVSTSAYKVPIYIRDKKTFKTLPVTTNIYCSSRTQTTLSLSAIFDCGDATNTGANGIQWSQGSSIGEDYTTIPFNKTDSAAHMETILTGLHPNTTYCARAYVVTAEGDTTYSDVITRDTKSITCNIAFTQTHTTISLFGSYDCGDATNTGINGIQWNIGTSDEDYTTIPFNTTDSAAQMETTLTGLQPNTTYCARAYVVTAESDTIYSNVITCTTKAITTTTSTTIRTQTKLGVSLEYDWGDADNITKYGYKVVGTSIADTLSATGTITEPIKIDKLVTGLTPNTKYTFRTFIETRGSVDAGGLSEDFSKGISEWEKQTNSYGKWGYANGVCTFTSSYKYDETFGWLFHSANLIGGTEYTFRVRVKKQYTGDWYVVPDMAIGIGSRAKSSSMTTIVSKETLSTEYEEVVGTYIPAKSGIYYVGLYGHMKDPGSANYTNIIYFDDFLVFLPQSGKVPTYIYNERIYSTLPIELTFQSTQSSQTKATFHITYDAGDLPLVNSGIQYCIGSSFSADEAQTFYFNRTDSALALDTTITGLTPNMEYVFRAFVETKDEKIYSTTRKATTLPVTIYEPTLTQYGQTYMLLATSSNYGDATLVEEAVEYGTSQSEIQTASVSNNMVKINDLFPDTRYYYRSLLTTTEGGTIYSDWQEMTTKAITLSTGEADGISAKSVFLHGTIDCDMESRTEIGFEWKRSDAPATIKPQRVLVTDRADSTLVFRLEGLSKDKYYDFRAFCLYKEQTYYGKAEDGREWVTFLTALEDVLVAPSVQTLGAEVSEAGVVLSGFVVAGTENIIQKGFESWRKGTTDVATTVSEGAVMTNEIPEPWSYTTYQYRAYAKTPSGTTYGETKEVTTGYIHKEITDVVVTPSATTATVTWTIVEQADYYILTLFGNAEMTDTLATYTVDEAGNITQRRAPAALRALVNCSIDQLTPETDYFFTVIAYNSDEKKVAEENGSFTTQLTTDIDNISDNEGDSDTGTGNHNANLVRKVFRNGQVYILRGDKTYTLTGVEIE